MFYVACSLTVSYSYSGGMIRVLEMEPGTLSFYPEGAVGNIDVTPGDDDGVFYGLGGNVDTEEGSVAIVCDLDVDGVTF